MNNQDQFLYNALVVQAFGPLLTHHLKLVGQPCEAVYERASRDAQAAASCFLSTASSDSNEPRRQAISISLPRKKIIPFLENDTKNVLWNKNPDYYKTGVEISLLDLSRSTVLYAYDHADRTDLVSRTGKISHVIIALKDSSAPDVVEHFKVPCGDILSFGSEKDPFNRSTCHLDGKIQFPVWTKTHTQMDGKPSFLMQSLEDFTISTFVHVTAELNAQTGIMCVSGEAKLGLHYPQGKVDTAKEARVINAFNTVEAEFVAYSTELYFDQEDHSEAIFKDVVSRYTDFSARSFSHEGPHCPAADEKILLANFEKDGPGELIYASDIVPGQHYVWTRHEHTGEWGAYPVIRKEMGDVPIWKAEGHPRTSGEHEFMNDDLSIYTMDSIGVPDGEGTVVSLEIEDAHTYVVGDKLSHNKTMQQ